MSGFEVEEAGRKLQELGTAGDEGTGVGVLAHGHTEALPAAEICHKFDTDRKVGAWRSYGTEKGIVADNSWGCKVA